MAKNRRKIKADGKKMQNNHKKKQRGAKLPQRHSTQLQRDVKDHEEMQNNTKQQHTIRNVMTVFFCAAI